MFVALSNTKGNMKPFLHIAPIISLGSFLAAAERLWKVNAGKMQRTDAGSLIAQHFRVFSILPLDWRADEITSLQTNKSAK